MEGAQWNEVWTAVNQILEKSIVPSLLRTWVHPLELKCTEPLEDLEGQGPGLRIQLEAPNHFNRDWILGTHRKLIESAFTQVVGTPCVLDVYVNQNRSTTENRSSAVAAAREALSPIDSLENHADGGVQVAEEYGVESASAPSSFDRGSSASPFSINPGYVFENFVVGSSNQFAYASAVAVSERPGHQYNPLFIYSPPGLGKTHLCHAIANHVLHRNPDTRVYYITAENFINELVDSLTKKRMPQFRSKYRDSFDVLIIDDIQFIAGKESTQEEFFHTFNTLYASKRQLVLTSDRPPKDIEKLEERIRTRFEWGLVADIQPPEIETRIAILKSKAEREDIYLPDDVATFVATHIKDNVRKLEGVLVKIQAQASLTGAEISLELAKHELKSMLPEEGSLLTVENILTAAANHYNITVKEIKSTTRTKALAVPRQIAMYLVRKYTGISFKEIGEYLGKNHSTVVHACKKIEHEMESDSEVRHAVEQIQDRL